ncbi:hypothetical protein [Gemmatimonas phototrophica]|uniref:Uncharacterized protein n=1 Tax=Gemmatimonas phototrophica TaxID=1379270 RepID=A0A143BH03_9BACT|nr:hypothetical protein [Gemmatimonas phototrophica]AMW04309.1 hypothetical protein GEMMAAP_04560 [Gemmatimonas phototrophica]
MTNAVRQRFAAAFLLFTAACGGGGDSPTTPAPPIAPAPVPPGIVSVASSGLPEGVNADIQLSGPLPGALFTRTAQNGTNWGDVPAGRYTVTVRPVRTALGVFAVSPASYEISVPSGAPVAVSAAYRAVPSAFAIVTSGLPAGVDAAISVTPPGGSATTVPQSTTLSGTAPTGVPTAVESWSLTAQPVTSDGARFAPSRTAFDTTVSFGDTARVAVAYTVATGSIAVAVTGLPAGLNGNVRVIGPDTTSRSVSSTTTITGLEPGRYRVVSNAVSQGGITYRPATDTLTLDVVASLTASPAPVVYAAQVGRLVLAASGLPQGASPSFRVVGGGIDRNFTSGGTVDSLPVGSYTVSALAVLDSTDRYAATPSSQQVTIATNASTSATFGYALASGAFTLTVNGLPTGLAGDVRVTGPNTFARTISATQTLRGLEPGRYTLSPRVVRNSAEAYGVQSGLTQGVATIDVSAGATPSAAALTYVLVPTVVDVPVTGLPSGTSAAIVLTDPSNATSNVTASYRAVPAQTGRWRLAASSVTTGFGVYAPSPSSYDETVLAGDTLWFGVQYTITTGSLAVTIGGLPNGSSGNVTVTGPGGYSRALTATTTITGLTPGSYTVAAANVSTGSGTYQPTSASQTVQVSASVVAAGATVTYILPGGAIAIAASGVPGGTTPVFTLTGPGGITRTQNGVGTVTALAVGAWSVAAANVSASGTTYSPTPTSAAVTVSANVTSNTSFAYAAVPAGTNYTISNVYLTQAIQKLDNSVALVANRTALLRVFVTASASNTARPDVRVRVYDGATLLSTNTITAPETSVRTSIAEGTLGSTWNVSIPGANIRTNTRILVDLDPTLAVPDNDRADNVWPSNGSPQLITVRTAPTFTVRFVPIIVGTDTGRVSESNKESFLTTTRRVWPISTVVSDVRAPFTSSATAIQSNDGNGNWLTALSEMNTLRATDGAPSSTYYYGVVRTSYSSGIAGYGYVPGRAAVGWDRLPSGDGVAAHEWGHNFSRSHAPCGTSGDANYPYAGGVIGNHGWNPSTNTLVAPTATDLMGYCGNTWISDYNWTAVMNYRQTAGSLVASANVKGDGLLVWGRVVDGDIRLEPAFRVTAPATPAARLATHRVELLDDNGASLLQLPIEASTVDHVQPGHEERQFAVVVPWSATLEQRLSQLRVSDLRVPLRTTSRRSTVAVPQAFGKDADPRAAQLADPAAALERAPRQVKVAWRNSSYAMAMVRDANTGEVMGFVRQNGAAVATGGRPVEVVFSDGVRSTVKR